MSNLLNIKDQSGNWIPIPVVTNGIKSIIQNEDYTLTITLNDGTTYTTTSIKGDKGDKGEKGDPATSMEIHICSASEYDAETRIPTIANPNDKTFYLIPTEDGTSPDLFTEWVYVNNAWEMFGSASVDLTNYVKNTDIANSDKAGVVKIDPKYGVGMFNDTLIINGAMSDDIKSANNSTKPVSTLKQHESTFYGLAKASGDKTQSQSDNPVGTYTDEAKASIKNMLGVEDVDIDSKAPVITETISGDIVSFDDGADDMPLQSLVVDIDPVQDLHGYDSPWVGGGGKNKYNKDSDYYGQSLFWASSNGTLVSNSDYYASPKIPVKADTQYARTSGTSANIFFDVNSNYLSTTFTGGTFTTPSDAHFVAFNIANSVNHDAVQLEEGSSLSAYSPYENICPISGWTGCEVQRTGKNIFDKDNVNALNAYIANDKVTTNPNHSSVYIPCKPNTTYTVQKICVGSGDQDRFSVGYTVETPSNGAACYGIIHSTGASRVQGQMVSLSITTGQDAKYLICWISYSTGYADSIATFQLELTSAATDYEPYTGRSIPITFPSEAGIVYGAYIDVINGELVVDRAIVDMGTLAWTKSSSRGVYFWVDLPLRKIGSALTSSLYPYYGTRPATYASASVGLYQETLTSDKFVDIYDPSYSDVAEIVSVLNGQQLVYELAEPIHYPLTATEIKTLLGQNNIFADTGNVSVTYRADSELYINKQIPDVPVEDVQINGTSILQDGVANIPVGGNDLGVVKENLAYGIDITGQGQLLLITPSDIELKKGYAGTRRAIMTLNQHIATFYGLAKAAGADEKDSTLPVGQYTDSAQTAIKQMLGVKDDYDSLVVEVSGTDPVITGKASYRYNCGELYTLSITPPSSGTMDIIFTSGATPTVLTLPETVKMPDWWAGIETNTTYEMCITDGTYCGVMSWAT